jgi:hypothetical protein
MPKQSGQDMKTVRLAPRPQQPKARAIMHQTPPAGPRLRPMSPAAPKFADELLPDPKGSIDPRQMR